MRPSPASLLLSGFLLSAVVVAGGPAEPPPSTPPPSDATAQPVAVRLETAMGPIDVEIDVAHAPLSAANFLRYVDAGRYDGGRFHRTVRKDNELRPEVPIEVVQAGVAPAHEAKEFPPIPLERTRDTGLRHLAGTLSMARDTTDSATSDFFICLTDLPTLDFGGARNPDGQGFAAFGRVTSGLDIVRRIQAAPASGQSLEPPIAILRASRLP
jgi:peptidyl-prolyl cis-trans isomerase A (cyclophilin A)